MSGDRVERLADILVGYCVAIKPGDRVWISTETEGLPLARAVFREVVRAGGHPFPMVVDEEMTEAFYAYAGDEQLDFVHEPTRHVYEHYEARISISAPANARYLSGIPSEKLQRRQLANRTLTETVMRRTADGSHRWVVTQFPTNASAQDADMSLAAYRDFVYGAYHLDLDDPLEHWRAVSVWQQQLVDWLAGRERVVVEGENIDLRLSITDRVFINDDGHFNMPGGEIFTGPVEDSVEGWVRFSYPAVFRGREVEGIELRFEAGKIVEATARKNEEFLLSVLDTDDGSRRLGEWAIGTNFGIDRFTRNILFDEKIGGTLHMAVGAGYPHTGSRNESAVHWDMICDLGAGARIVVDGDTFIEDGQITVAPYPRESASRK